MISNQAMTSFDLRDCLNPDTSQAAEFYAANISSEIDIIERRLANHLEGQDEVLISMDDTRIQHFKNETEVIRENLERHQAAHRTVEAKRVELLHSERVADARQTQEKGREATKQCEILKKKYIKYGNMLCEVIREMETVVQTIKNANYISEEILDDKEMFTVPDLAVLQRGTNTSIRIPYPDQAYRFLINRSTR